MRGRGISQNSFASSRIELSRPAAHFERAASIRRFLAVRSGCERATRRGRDLFWSAYTLEVVSISMRLQR